MLVQKEIIYLHMLAADQLRRGDRQSAGGHGPLLDRQVDAVGHPAGPAHTGVGPPGRTPRWRYKPSAW